MTWERALPRARELEHELANALEALNESLRQVEQVLTELNLGVTASVTLDESEDGWVQCLRFGKVGKGWRLLLESGPKGRFGEWHESPLLSASKEVRVRAVVMLPALFDALISEAESQLNQIKDRTAEAHALADKVAKKHP